MPTRLVAKVRFVLLRLFWGTLRLQMPHALFECVGLHFCLPRFILGRPEYHFSLVFRLVTRAILF